MPSAGGGVIRPPEGVIRSSNLLSNGRNVGRTGLRRVLPPRLRNRDRVRGFIKHRPFREKVRNTLCHATPCRAAGALRLGPGELATPSASCPAILPVSSSGFRYGNCARGGASPAGPARSVRVGTAPAAFAIPVAYGGARASVSVGPRVMRDRIQGGGAPNHPDATRP